MPVLLLQERCDHRPSCFAATACPNQALFYSETEGRVVVLPERCGDCRGPCLNFCDLYALKYAPTLEELRLLQAELDGSMSAEEIAQERARLQKKAEEERRARMAPQVTAATFQREVLQATLPVLVKVEAPAKQEDNTPQQLAQTYAGRLLIRRVDAYAERQLVAALQVRNLPTFLLFYRGQLVDGVTGMPSPAQLTAWINHVLDQIQAFELAEQEKSSPEALSIR